MHTWDIDTVAALFVAVTTIGTGFYVAGQFKASAEASSAAVRVAVEELKAQVREMRDDYEARLRLLERHVAVLDADNDNRR